MCSSRRARADRHDGIAREPDDLLRDAAQESSPQSAPSVCGHHHEFERAVLDLLEDARPLTSLAKHGVDSRIDRRVIGIIAPPPSATLFAPVAAPTVMTGTGAVRTTFSAMLPSTSRGRPQCP